MKDLLIELTAEPEVTKNVTECPIVASTFKPMEAKDFEFKSGNFVPLWHAAKVANARLSILSQMIERLIAKNKALNAELSKK